MNERVAALAKGLVDDPDATALWADVRALDADAQLQLAWQLKDLCFEIWTTNPPKAERVALVLTRLCSIRHSPEIVALRTWTDVVGHVASGQLSEVVDCVDVASTYFDGANASTIAAQVRNAKVMALAHLGRMTEAEECARSIRQVFIEYKDHGWAGKVEVNLGSLLLQQDRFVEAAQLYQQASVRFARVGDIERSILADIGLGDALADAFEFEDSLRAYERARQRAENRGFPLLATYIRQSLGLLENLRGQPSRALYWLELARRDYEASDDDKLLADCLRDLADVHLQVGLLPEACALYERAIASLDRIGSKLELSWARLHLGYALKGMGQRTEAAEIAATAASDFVELGGRVGASRAWLLQTEIAFDEGDTEQAENALANARGVFEGELPQLLERITDFFNARIAIVRGDTDGAEHTLQSLLARTDLDTEDSLRGDCFERLGWISESRGDAARAADHYRQAASSIEAQCAMLQSEEMQTSFRAPRQRAFERLVSVIAQTGDVSATLNAMERGRASVFPTTDSSIADIERSERAQSIKDQLNWAYRRLSKDIENDEENSALPSKIRALESELLEHYRRAKFTADGGSDVSVARTEIDIGEVQGKLSDHDVFVEFFCVDDDVFSVAITRTQAIVRRHANAAIAERVQQCRFQLEALRGSASHLAAHQDILVTRARRRLAELGHLLFEPIAPLSADKSRLLLVAHAGLHYVPFAALELDGKPLVEAFEIGMLSSARALLFADSEKRDGGAVRDVVDSRRALLVGSSHGGLAHVAQEIDVLGTLFPGSDCFLDESATVHRVMHAMPNARIIHLACHGQFRADSPYFSALHFADGAITVHDIGAMRLSADLVTLSACETGLSQLSPGDELLGLTRAFLRAGAKTIVNSLWAVDDAVTASLMTHFYRGIAQGATAAGALRSAQLAIRALHAHPYYWAGFSLTGSP